jgi:hypothetical protein
MHLSISFSYWPLKIFPELPHQTFCPVNFWLLLKYFHKKLLCLLEHPLYLFNPVLCVKDTWLSISDCSPSLIQFNLCILCVILYNKKPWSTLYSFIPSVQNIRTKVTIAWSTMYSFPSRYVIIDLCILDLRNSCSCWLW